MRVAMPVAGPGRIPTQTSTGVSVIPARLRPSHIRANPPPAVQTIAGAPANAAPRARLMAETSSSVCSTTSPASSARREQYSTIGVPGDIGYPVTNLTPAAIAPSAIASAPDIEHAVVALLAGGQAMRTGLLEFGRDRREPGAGRGDVALHDLLALAPELELEHLGELAGSNADQGQRRADCDRVHGDRVFAVLLGEVEQAAA